MDCFPHEAIGCNNDQNVLDSVYVNARRDVAENRLVDFLSSKSLILILSVEYIVIFLY